MIEAGSSGSADRRHMHGIQGAHAWETWTKDGECFALLGMDPAAEVTVRPLGAPITRSRDAPKLDNHNGVVVVSGFGDDTPATRARSTIDGQEFGLLIYNVPASSGRANPNRRSTRLWKPARKLG